MLGPDPRVVIKRERLREDKAGKVATYKESQAVNSDFMRTMSSGAGKSTILVATLASCFTSAEGSVDDEGHHVFPARDWLMIVMVTAAILFAGILLSYHLVHRRVMKVVTLRVLERFEQWSLISFATWFCTICAFACGELFGGVAIGCCFVENYIDKKCERMILFYKEEQRSHMSQFAAELKALSDAIKDQGQTTRHRLEGARVYLKHVIDNLHHSTDFAMDGIGNHQRHLHGMMEHTHGRNSRILGETNSGVYSVQRGMRRLLAEADLGTSSMGSDERRSVLRRRLFRHGRSGTPTSSPGEADFSDEEPVDDHATEQAMLQAVRLANLNMEFSALIEHLTAGRGCGYGRA